MSKELIERLDAEEADEAGMFMGTTRVELVAERDALAAELKALRARLKTGGEARACQSCNGHGQVGGFGGWAAPGYIAEECPACLGSGHDWQPGADDLVGLRGCNSRHGGRATDLCKFQARMSDPGCAGCEYRGKESQPMARRVEKIEAESLALKDILFRALLNITGDDWREAASEATKGYSPYQPGKDLSGSCK